MSLREIQEGQPGVVATLTRGGLRALSWAYGAGVTLRSLAYGTRLRSSVRLPVAVVSVGNLAAGGTGKTPFVIWIARRLLRAGRHPGILARGYGAPAFGEPDLNDEGAVIRRAVGARVPQVQRGSRVRGGRALLAAHPEVDVLLLDDGFQHRRIARDLDIVLLDATAPPGADHLLPRGMLREPFSALARADVVVVTRTERADELELGRITARVRQHTEVPVLAARTRAVGVERDGAAASPEALEGKRVWACCGIGNPAGFRALLADLGADVAGLDAVSDHALLPPGGWERVVATGRAAGAELVVTTRKDAVKYERLPEDVAVLDIETEVDDPANRLLSGLTPK